MNSTPQKSTAAESRRHRIVGLVQIGLIIGVIALAIAINIILSRSATGPGLVAQGSQDIVVEVVRPSTQPHPIVVEETGTVQVRAYVNLSPQVGGRVLEVSPDMAAGGTFAAGEVLFRIDPADYEYAAAQARASLLSAQSALDLELAEAETARQEWELVNPGEDIPALVARTPQIQQARAALASARAVLDNAETNLARVDYSLPFDGRVVATSVVEGQTLAANQSYGEVYRLSALEVAVPVSVDTLSLLEPAVGRSARIRIGNTGRVANASVIRQEAELDSQTRFAMLIVGFDEPPALLPGAFVEAEIDGGNANDAMMLPASAIGTGGRVWVVEQGQLQARVPTIIAQDDTEVHVRAFDTANGVVTTPMAAPVAGFPVRIAGEAAITPEHSVAEEGHSD